MRKVLLAFARANGGVVTHQEATSLVAAHVLKDAVRSAVLVRVLPRTYALAERATDVSVLRRAALACRPDAALSHTDALAVWALLPPGAGGPPVHLTTSVDRSGEQPAGLVVHRYPSFRLERAVVAQGVRVVRLEEAIVRAWPLLGVATRQQPAIVAVRERRTTAARLLAELDAARCPKGTADMRALFRRLDLGLHSELEIWGHERVFADPRLPRSRAQVPVLLVSGRMVYLDRLFDEEMLVVELDGAAYHASWAQRQRDARRDSDLAVLGYVTVRVTHERLSVDPDGFIRDLLGTLERRRRQLGLTSA